MQLEDLLKKAFDIFKAHWLTLILGGIIATIGSMFIITAPPLMFGLYYMTIKAAKGEEIEATNVVKGFNYFVTSWIMTIVAGISILIGLVLLVIPGLILTALLEYAIPIAITENIGAIDALKKSYAVGRKNFTFTILLFIILLGLSFISSYIPFAFIVTMPFFAICWTIATLELSGK